MRIKKSKNEIGFLEVPYIGFTSNMKQRLDYHNSGKSRYTSRKIPWILVYQEKYQTRSEAIKRETFLKKQRNRTFYKRVNKKQQMNYRVASFPSTRDRHRNKKSSFKRNCFFF